MGALQKLFTVHGADYLQRFGEVMPATHQKVMAAMVACRTPQAGALLCGCTQCGQPHLLLRSCGNRHCPSCQGRKAFEWLQRQLERALPTHHFLLTFTVPEALRAFLRSNQRLGYEALFAASAGAIRTLARAPRFKLGDQPGFFGVLHTWGRTLQYHPHIHYVVPGGALATGDRQWHAASPGFFLPVHALSTIYRGKFREAIARAGLLADIPDAVWKIAWNVNCQPVGDAANTLGYLARYVFKVAISDQRILGVDEGLVLRHYGFLSPSFGVPFAEVRARIEMAHGFAAKPVDTDIDAPAPKPMVCSHCGGALKLLRVMRPAPQRPSLVSASSSSPAAPAALTAGP
ncbi:MAG: transposase [Betaproteobacteria bacterium]|nr:transposase [Betaproteobacteria bacterium]